jgi:TonB family protein
VTPTRPSASATTVPVEVRWEGSNTVNIVIDGTAYAFRGGQMQLLKVKPNATLELYVQVPGKKIYAEEFLLIEPEGGFLEVKLNGDSVVFQYETLSERSLRERREIEQQQEDDLKSIEYQDVNPSFPGGTGALSKFLNENLRYPEFAISMGLEGTVIVGFVVKSNGEIHDISIIRGIIEALDDEAKRVVGVMPRWNPGTQNQKPVDVKIRIPISFKLDDLP